MTQHLLACLVLIEIEDDVGVRIILHQSNAHGLRPNVEVQHDGGEKLGEELPVGRNDARAVVDKEADVERLVAVVGCRSTAITTE